MSHRTSAPPIEHASASLLRCLDQDATRYVARTTHRFANLVGHRDEMVALLQREVSKLWPDAECALFGSCAVGLANEGSDVDLVVMHVPPEPKLTAHQQQASCAQRLAQQLGDASWVRSIKTIDRSLTPIISLVCVAPSSSAEADIRLQQRMRAVLSPPASPAESTGGGRPPGSPAEALRSSGGEIELSLDVSFDAPAHHGLEAVRLMNEQCRVLPLARPLVLVIKAVLEQRSLKRAYSGGLSSYAVFIMAVRFLRDREYQQRAEGTAPDGSLGRALLDFLRFFARTFEPDRQGITLREGGRYDTAGGGGYLHRDHPGLAQFRCDSLLVLDPVNPANNICKHCYRVHEVLRAFGEALAALEGAVLNGGRLAAKARAAERAANEGGGETEWQVLHAVLNLE